jgi:uncharacterized Ntn-hydrolase superfamily protein
MLLVSITELFWNKEVFMFVVFLLLIYNIPSYGTFSIVAMDSETDAWGVAVASRVPDVGYIVPWIEPGVGAVATQAYANPYFGPRILEILSQGKSAHEALNIVIQADTLPEQRQVGIVDKNGQAAAHTGKNNLVWAGHKTASSVTVQGNILTGPEVIDSMLAVFQRTDGPLAERLLAALEKGENAGGDKRGKQSAALYVVRKRGGYQGVDDRLVDLKVMDSPEPVKELRRLYTMWQYIFLAPAYLRLADEEKDKADIFLKRTHTLLLTALGSDLSDPEVYNSLAWEFALRRMYPEQTLEAAKRAHELAPDEPHIMDTLAEAYYIIGDYDKAVYWEKEALKRTPDEEFYKKQLKKFEEASKNK